MHVNVISKLLTAVNISVIYQPSAYIHASITVRVYVLCPVYTGWF